jgi:hypothetical protein
MQGFFETRIAYKQGFLLTFNQSPLFRKYWPFWAAKCGPFSTRIAYKQGFPLTFNQHPMFISSAKLILVVWAAKSGPFSTRIAFTDFFINYKNYI